MIRTSKLKWSFQGFGSSLKHYQLRLVSGFVPMSMVCLGSEVNNLNHSAIEAPLWFTSGYQINCTIILLYLFRYKLLDNSLPHSGHCWHPMAGHTPILSLWINSYENYCLWFVPELICGNSFHSNTGSEINRR